MAGVAEKRVALAVKEATRKIGYKWKNHFVEMKGDVGMSVHEKGGKQVNATPTHKTIYNPIPTSL